MPGYVGMNFGILLNPYISAEIHKDGFAWQRWQRTGRFPGFMSKIALTPVVKRDIIPQDDFINNNHCIDFGRDSACKVLSKY